MTKLQYLRVERGLSKRRLSRMSGVADSVIRRIERGEAYGNITLRTFKRLADALGVEVFDLIEPELIK